jgi:hypothetical protein
MRSRLLRFLALCMASAASLLSASCEAVLMERPLSDAKTSVFDERLLGEWIPATEDSRDEQDTYFFGRNQEQKTTLDLIWVAKRNGRIMSMPLQAYVTVAKNRYISFVYRGKEDNSPTSRRAAAYKYEMPDDETLWLWSIDREFIKAAIERRELHGIVESGSFGQAAALDEHGKPIRAPVVALRPWERPEGTNIDLTDPPSTILAFLERNDVKCFRHLDVYTRVPRLSALRHH